MKTSPEIKIGYPANTRMAEDCRPISELLEFEKGELGTFRSRFLPDAEFCPRRVSDIGRFVKSGIFELGIIGDDTACEVGLEISGWSQEILEQARRIKEQEKKKPFDSVLEQYLYYPENRVARLRLGDPIFMTLFARREKKDAFPSPNQLFGVNGKIATSYPRLAEKSLRLSNYLQPVKIEKYDGQIEAIVANQDDPQIVGGLDLVRTGRTMERFGLVSYGSIMESKPGIWRSPVLTTDARKKTKIEETIAALKERLSEITL
jgi:ATP phosphoribosyltransferase